MSFDRFYFGDETHGMGQLPVWELPMPRWLEANGYDVSYAMNVDVDLDPDQLLSHKAFLSVRHDEYWSWRMRDHVEAAPTAGSAWASSRATGRTGRCASSRRRGAPDRIMVGYKEDVARDPLYPTDRSTARWRDPLVNRPEHAMMGVGFITQARPILVVEDA